MASFFVGKDVTGTRKRDDAPHALRDEIAELRADLRERPPR